HGGQERRSVFEKILVPLDESELSHRILTPVRRFLLATDAEVRLIRVVTREEVAFDETDDAADRARGHLAHVADLLRERGCRTSFEVQFGDPAERILAAAEEYSPSLIAMSSHG